VRHDNCRYKLYKGILGDLVMGIERARVNCGACYVHTKVIQKKKERLVGMGDGE